MCTRISNLERLRLGEKYFKLKKINTTVQNHQSTISLYKKAL